MDSGGHEGLLSVERFLRQLHSTSGGLHFGISEGCLHRWLKIANREDGLDAGTKATSSDASAELREARKRIKLLEQEAEVMRRAVAYLSRDVNPK